MTLQDEVSQNYTIAYYSSKSKKSYNTNTVRMQCIVTLLLIYYETSSVIVFNRLHLFMSASCSMVPVFSLTDSQMSLINHQSHCLK